MNDKEVMHHRFSHKNIKKKTGQLCKELGMTRKAYEDSVKRGMSQEHEEDRERRLEKLKADFAEEVRKTRRSET